MWKISLLVPVPIQVPGSFGYCKVIAITLKTKTNVEKYMQESALEEVLYFGVCNCLEFVDILTFCSLE